MRDKEKSRKPAVTKTGGTNRCLAGNEFGFRYRSSSCPSDTYFVKHSLIQPNICPDLSGLNISLETQIPAVILEQVITHF
jgi:hypothetical protein